MAQVAFGIAGGVIGSLYGNWQMGFSLGMAVGGMLFPEKLPPTEQGKLTDLRPMGSSYGSAISIVYGAGRVGGNLIWATDLAEHRHEETQGGKGGAESTSITYTYSCSMAALVCEGPISKFVRIWADDKVIWASGSSGTTGFECLQIASTEANPDGRCEYGAIRMYTGEEDQNVDTLMDSILGSGNTPAHRGYAYVVFENFDLSQFGNRIPQFSFEVSTTKQNDSWESETVGVALDYSTWYGYPIAIGTSESGTVSVMYGVDPPSYGAKAYWTYGERNSVSGEWVVEDHPDGNPNLYNEFSASILWDGNIVHVFYDDETDEGVGRLIHAWRNDGVWHYEVVCDNQDSVESAQVAVHSGVFHIVFWGNDGDLVYCYGSTGDWTIPGNDITDGHGSYSLGIAVDHLGVPHIVYGSSAGNAQYLMHSVWTGDSWTSEIIYDGEDDSVAVLCGCAFTPDGVLHVVNSEYVSKRIMHCWKDTTWHTEAICTYKYYSGDNGIGFHVTASPSDGRVAYTVAGLTLADWPSDQAEGPVIGILSNGTWTHHLLDDFNVGDSVFSCWTATGLDVACHRYTSDTNFDCVKYYRQTSGSASIPLSDVLADLAGRVGLILTDYDFSQADNIVTGLVIATRSEIREIISRVLQSYFVDLVESDGKIKAVKRGGAAAATIPAGDLGAVVGFDSEGKNRTSLTRKQDIELPRRIDVSYYNPANGFQNSTQGSVRESIETTENTGSLDTGLAMSDDEGRELSGALLYDAWASRTEAIITLPIKYLKYSSGDILNLPTKLGLLRVRIMQDSLAPFGPVAFRVITDDSESLVQNLPGSPISQPPALPDSGGSWAQNTAHRDVWDGIAPGDDFGLLGQFTTLAAATSPDDDYRGATIYVSFDNGASYGVSGTLPSRAQMGIAATELAAPVLECTAAWDKISTVDVTLTNGTLASCSVAEALAGFKNRAYIGNEIVSFTSVEPLGDNSYRLSNLLRGQWGTDPAWATHAIGERFVLLERGSVVQGPGGAARKGQEFLVKIVRSGMTLADTPAITVNFQLRAMMPFSVCAVTGSRDGSDNLALSWTRRNRHSGDMRDNFDIPIIETLAPGQYAFDIEILDGADVVRTLQSNTESVVYTAADQVTDFGSTQANVVLRIYQNNEYGRGNVKEETV